MPLLLPDGRRAVFGPGWSSVWIVDLVSGDALRSYQLDDGMVTALAVYERTGQIAAGTTAGTMALLDPGRDEPLIRVPQSGAVHELVFTKDGGGVIAADPRDPQLSFWKSEVSDSRQAPAKGARRRGLRRPSPLRALDPAGGYEARALGQPIWTDLRTVRRIKSRSRHAEPVTGMRFSRDGLLLATADADHIVRVIDAKTGFVVTEFHADTGSTLTQLVFDDSGRRLLVGNQETGAALDLCSVHDTRNGRTLGRLRAWPHGDHARLRLLGDGRHVVCSDDGGTDTTHGAAGRFGPSIRLFDLDRCELVARWDVACLPEDPPLSFGDKLVVALNDGSVQHIGPLQTVMDRAQRDAGKEHSPRPLPVGERRVRESFLRGGDLVIGESSEETVGAMVAELREDGRRVVEMDGMRIHDARSFVRELIRVTGAMVSPSAPFSATWWALNQAPPAGDGRVIVWRNAQRLLVADPASYARMADLLADTRQLAFKRELFHRNLIVLMGGGAVDWTEAAHPLRAKADAAYNAPSVLCAQLM